MECIQTSVQNIFQRVAGVERLFLHPLDSPVHFILYLAAVLTHTLRVAVDIAVCAVQGLGDVT